MFEQYKDRANFLTIYVKEAHPQDEWRIDSNEKEGVCYMQPKTMAERVAIANNFVKKFGYKIPLVIDPIENPANEAYAGWPERFYIVETDGSIVYKGKPGPFGYHPEEIEDWLKKRFAA